jgi:hypothetical protein
MLGRASGNDGGLRIGSWKLYLSAFPLAQAKWLWWPKRERLVRHGQIFVPYVGAFKYSCTEREFYWLCFVVYAFGPRKYV